MYKIRFGVYLPQVSWKNTSKIALFADKHNFYSVWMPDHILGIRWAEHIEAWTVLSALAIQTKNVKLGTGVTDPYRRHPVTLAQSATTLDIISKGRFMLGMGAGEAMNLNPYGIRWDHPVSRLREATIVVKKLWTQDKVNFDGDFFKFKEAFLMPRPIQKPHPPIWIAASSTKSMMITAELANGWLPLLLAPEEYKERLELIRQRARSLGGDEESIEPGLWILTSVSKDREKAIQSVSLPTRIFFSLFPKIMERIGLEEYVNKKLDVLEFTHNNCNMNLLLNNAKRMPFEPLAKFTVCGTKDECIEQLNNYYKAGVRHFALVLVGQLKSQLETMKHFSETIIPYFSKG